MIPTAKEIMCQLENEVIWDTEGVILADWRKDIEQDQRKLCADVVCQSMAGIALTHRWFDLAGLAEAVLNAGED